MSSVTPINMLFSRGTLIPRCNPAIAFHLQDLLSPMAPPPHRTLVNFLAPPFNSQSNGAQSVGTWILTTTPSPQGSKDECVLGEEPGLDSAR